MDIPSEKSSPYTATVQIWRNCNFTCAYCSGAKERLEHDWTEHNDKCAALLTFLNRTDQWDLLLVGGEPVINPYFPTFCREILAGGHSLSFFSNGSRKLDELFTFEEIKRFREVRLSYQPQHESSATLHESFEYNAELVVRAGVACTVIYILLPERTAAITEFVKRISAMGATVLPIALNGFYGGGLYPEAYDENQRQLAIDLTTDVNVKYLFRYGYYRSFGKRCGAGFSKFNILLASGSVTPCTERNSVELFNFLKDDPADFTDRIYRVPRSCPVKVCTCGFTIEQQALLDSGEPDYERWVEISRPLGDEAAAAVQHNDRKFVLQLQQKLAGTQVYLWGGGVHTAQLIPLMVDNGFPAEQLLGVVDSNPDNAGRSIHGKGVLSSEDFWQHHAANCSDIVISSQTFEPEIYEQLEPLAAGRINLIKLYGGDLVNRPFATR